MHGQGLRLFVGTDHFQQKMFGGDTMKNEYTAVMQMEEDRWVGWIEEIPGTEREEDSCEALRDSLQQTLRRVLMQNMPQR